MAIPTLTDEQIRTMTVQEKDRWWLANVFRGDMPQLTLKSAITGFLLGGILSATNLYVSAKTGITLGVGLTSVILAFGMFKVLSSLRIARDFTILENNAMQSIATAAGYMTVPLMSSFTAYFWKTNTILPWWQLFAFNIVTALMGVLVAFPMKRRFINDEQQPFPEGRACGVVLDTLYQARAPIGMLQAKALVVAATITGLLHVATGEAYMRLLWVHALGKEKYYVLTEQIDAWYYHRVAIGEWPMPRIMGADFNTLGLRGTVDLAMLGTGGLMGIKTSSSMLIGMLVNYAILAPMMIKNGDIVTRTMNGKTVPISQREILTQWSICWGVGIMVVGSLVALCAKPKIIIDSFRGMFGKKASTDDPVGHIEMPLKVSFIGLPVLALITAVMAHQWYGVPYWMTIVALPLIFALSLICTNAMALTSWTPTGALAKIPQFTFGVMDRTNPGVNLMTAGITASVASNAANLLSDIKPGYMLGGKPRQQAWGHVIGIVAGACVSTPLFYFLFLGDATPDKPLQEVMATEKFTMPSAVQWHGVAMMIEQGFSGLKESAKWSLIVAAFAALAMEVARLKTKGKFWLSPVSIGLGVVLPPNATMCMWVGALVFGLLHKLNEKREGSAGHTIWVRSMEPICAGIIAGAALTGIGDALVKAFLLPILSK